LRSGSDMSGYPRKMSTWSPCERRLREFIAPLAHFIRSRIKGYEVMWQWVWFRRNVWRISGCSRRWEWLQMCIFFLQLIDQQKNRLDTNLYVKLHIFWHKDKDLCFCLKFTHFSLIIDLRKMCLRINEQNEQLTFYFIPFNSFLISVSHIKNIFLCLVSRSF